jgi:hypothetical protein
MKMKILILLTKFVELILEKLEMKILGDQKTLIISILIQAFFLFNTVN